MNLPYLAVLNLPNAWQIGTSPVITYDHKASHGNEWNVPIRLIGARTTRIGRMPVQIQFGIAHSVMSQDDFGTRALFEVNLVLVVSSLVDAQIFGGGWPLRIAQRRIDDRVVGNRQGYDGVQVITEAGRGL